MVAIVTIVFFIVSSGKDNLRVFLCVRMVSPQDAQHTSASFRSQAGAAQSRPAGMLKRSARAAWRFPLAPGVNAVAKLLLQQVVGWVERSDTHRFQAVRPMGFARAQPILRGLPFHFAI
jgi:hypothetical protein